MPNLREIKRKKNTWWRDFKIRLRIHLLGQKQETVAKDYDLTRQRVQQIAPKKKKIIAG